MWCNFFLDPNYLSHTFCQKNQFSIWQFMPELKYDEVDNNDGSHLGPKGGYLEDALDGEHGGEDQVEVGEHVRELKGRALELQQRLFASD